MLSIYDNATAKTAFDQPLDPVLKEILEARLSDAESLGLGDLTHIIVIEPADTEQAILDEIGWSPLIHPIDEVRYGSPAFTPYWSWLQDLGGWYELLHTVGNAGFAYILIIENGDSAFSQMCEAGMLEGDQPCAF